MYHVVYWAYSKKLNLNYIGSKSFKKFSEFENYKTSSSNWEFRENISEKRILDFFNTHQEAKQYESELQLDFDVSNNQLFANRTVEKGEENPFYGKKHSKESRKLISEANYLRFQNPEARKKQSECQRGLKKHTEESKRKISEFHKGRKRSKEFCERNSYRQTDHTKYHWVLMRRGFPQILDERIATSKEFQTEFGVSQGNLSEIKRGKRRQTRGWYCCCLLNQP